MRTLIALLLLAAPLAASEPPVAAVGPNAGPIVKRDLAYAEPKNPRQTIDVYQPADGEEHPIFFWIHGGGWQVGDKAEVDNKPQALMARGFVLVSINYRLLPEATIKQMAEDCARAIRWTCDHAQEFKADPRTIIIAGHSAGAQLAALISTDDSYLKAQGLSLAIVKGCVPVDGDTYDVPLQIATEPPKAAEGHSKKFGGTHDSHVDLSPVTHIAAGKDIPPFLILHVAGQPGTTLQAKRLAEVLEKAGISAKVVSAEGKTHGTINSGLGLADDKPTAALWEFLDRTLVQPKHAKSPGASN